MTLSSGLCYELLLACISVCLLPKVTAIAGICFDPNEEYTDCGSSCPAICGEPKQKICTALCVPGCFCKPGFIRIKGGGCIPEEACVLTPPGVCSDITEEYTECGTACPDICDEPPPKVCTFQCVLGCFCRPGYIRSTRGGRCIPKILCSSRPPSLPPPPVCRDINEEYTDCGTACPDICDQPPPGACTLQCVPGCFCKPGFIRSTKGGLCIPKNVCPPRPPCSTTPPGNCGVNEVYTGGSACPPICDEPPPEACIAVEVIGCFCKTGFIRRTRGGECIPESLCRNRPGRCPANEEYQQCGTLCPPTCQNPDPELCPDLCVKGCFCKRGFIRKTKGGPCIRKHSCSHRHIRCHHNEEYNACATTCPGFCDPIQGPVYPLCEAFCVKGCVCKEGFIRTKGGGSCIPLSLCVPRKGDFCPPTSNQICIRASNKCCSSADCPNRQLCCSENCGNTCKNPVKHETSGTRVTADKNCKIDPL